LIVVEHRNIQDLLELLLDVETFRGFDVLQVDAAKRRCQRFDDGDDLLGVVRVDLDIEDVNVCETLEQHSLPFHNRLGCQRSPVSQSQDRGAVAHHSNQVSLRRIAVRQRRITVYLLDRNGHPRRVGKGKVTLCDRWFCWHYLDLSGAAFGVVLQGLFP